MFENVYNLSPPGNIPAPPRQPCFLMIEVRGAPRIDTLPLRPLTKGDPMAQGRQRHDTLWKELLQDFFPQFLELFFPQIYADLDFESHGHEFLDKELQSI
jgi:hypothetical protein